MAQKEIILKDNYIYRKALMQNHDLEIQEVNGEVTMTAGDPEKADTRQVGAVLLSLFGFFWKASHPHSYMAVGRGREHGLVTYLSCCYRLTESKTMKCRTRRYESTCSQLVCVMWSLTILSALAVLIDTQHCMLNLQIQICKFLFCVNRLSISLPNG